MRVSIVSNPSRDKGYTTAYELAAQLLKKGCTVKCDANAAGSMPQGVGEARGEALFKGVDAMCVIGGDGTILSCVPFAVRYNTPLLCINRGHVGFLSEDNAADPRETAARLMNGEYQIEKRMALECAVYRDEDLLKGELYGLNEFCVRGSDGKLISFKVMCGEDNVGHYTADGMIVASPTGSTGYSLSAGGPVVSPALDCILLTAICAHSLRSKPAVVGPDETIKLSTRQPTYAMKLFCDGSEIMTLGGEEHIEIKRCRSTVNFIRFGEHNFYDLLKRKLSEW